MPPSIIDDISHPESFINFTIFGVIIVTLALVGIVASIAVLRSRSDDNARMAAYTALGVMAAAIVISGIAALSLEDDVAAAGDLNVVAEKVEFSPTALSGSGTVGILVNNKDPIRHTFAIEDLDIEVELPASTKRRVEVSGPPGIYEFVCTIEGHDDMKGTLTIGG